MSFVEVHVESWAVGQNFAAAGHGAQNVSPHLGQLCNRGLHQLAGGLQVLHGRLRSPQHPATPLSCRCRHVAVSCSHSVSGCSHQYASPLVNMQQSRGAGLPFASPFGSGGALSGREGDVTAAVPQQLLKQLSEGKRQTDKKREYWSGRENTRSCGVWKNPCASFSPINLLWWG